MGRIQSFLALALLVGACDSESQGSTTSAPAPAARSASEVPAAAASHAAVADTPLRSQAIDEPPPELDPAGILDDEERRLLEADDATLTRDERVARAAAQRELLMADPEHPLRPVLQTIERKVASGEARIEAQARWSGRTAFPDRDEEQSPHG